MSNPMTLSILVLAESVAARIPGSFDKLRLVLRTIGVDETTHNLVRETLGQNGYHRLVA